MTDQGETRPAGYTTKDAPLPQGGEALVRYLIACPRALAYQRFLRDIAPAIENHVDARVATYLFDQSIGFGKDHVIQTDKMISEATQVDKRSVRRARKRLEEMGFCRTESYEFDGMLYEVTLNLPDSTIKLPERGCPEEFPARLHDERPNAGRAGVDDFLQETINAPRERKRPRSMSVNSLRETWDLAVLEHYGNTFGQEDWGVVTLAKIKNTILKRYTTVEGAHHFVWWCVGSWDSLLESVPEIGGYREPNMRAMMDHIALIEHIYADYAPRGPQ